MRILRTPRINVKGLDAFLRIYFTVRVTHINATGYAYSGWAMPPSDTLVRLRDNLHRLLNDPNVPLTKRTQKALSERTGLALSTINGLFTAKRATSIENLGILASALGVDVEELFRKPSPDLPRQRVHVTIGKRETGAADADSTSKVVRALDAIIQHDPHAAAEAIAALIGHRPAEAPQPEGPRPRARARQRPPRKLTDD